MNRSLLVSTTMKEKRGTMKEKTEILTEKIKTSKEEETIKGRTMQKKIKRRS